MVKEDGRDVYLEGDSICFRLGKVGQVLSHLPILGGMFVEPRRQRTYFVTDADRQRVIFRETHPAREAGSSQFGDDVDDAAGEINTDSGAPFIDNPN